MLFILTGDVQIGKSRWLERLVDSLSQRSVPSYGVLAPGIWVASEGQAANADGLEKVGIDSVLLPQGQRVPFAARADLVGQAQLASPATQSERAKLGWRISDSALDQVNGHFRQIRACRNAAGRPGLLVVDELGRLELLREEGLVEAMAALAEGPSAQLPHALVVARSALAGHAERRFAGSWGGCRLIGPDESGKAAVLEAFGLG